MNDSRTASTLSPEGAFSLLGDETRIAIIRALGETSDELLSFSALRDRVAVADSGQFNYHLTKLVGNFIARTDEGEYELTYAGGQVIGAIFSGTYNQRSAPRAFELDSDCTVCGSALSAEYEHERVTISCPACDDRISTFGFPPGAFEKRSHTELARAFDTWIRSFLSATFGGFCLTCASRMHGSIVEESAYFEEMDVGTEHVCERCTNTTTNSIGAYLVYQPAVVAFHYDHGIDLTETPIWELPWLRDEQNEIIARDPWRVKSIVRIDGDRLECVVSEDLSVTVV
jgi:DNA-binding transcriptional ArsR family regulator